MSGSREALVDQLSSALILDSSSAKKEKKEQRRESILKKNETFENQCGPTWATHGTPASIEFRRAKNETRFQPKHFRNDTTQKEVRR